MKIDKKSWLVGAILVVVIIIIAAFVFVKKSASQNDNGSAHPGVASVNSGHTAVAAHSYIAVKTPTLATGDHILGDASTPLKIFVYEDYSSLYSANLADTLNKILAADGNRLALIVRPYGQNSPAAQLAARAVDCAGAQGKWQAMRTALFVQAKKQPAGNFDFSANARQIGLDENSFAVCLTNEEKSGTIEQATRAAVAYGVQGAPTMFIGDDMIIGARPYEDFTDSNGDKIAGLKSVVDAKLQ